MIKKEKELLTKAVKGLRTADAANAAVRYVLWALTENSTVTVEDMEEALDFFDWKCPYTGVDLREKIAKGSGFSVDHISGQNQQECGLNMKGNLVYVDSEANSQKGGKSVEDFMRGNSKCLAGVSVEEREARIEKIKEFQKKYDYNAELIKMVLQPKLQELYKGIQDELEEKASEIRMSIMGD